MKCSQESLLGAALSVFQNDAASMKAGLSRSKFMLCQLLLALKFAKYPLLLLLCCVVKSGMKELQLLASYCNYYCQFCCYCQGQLQLENSYEYPWLRSMYGSAAPSGFTEISRFISNPRTGFIVLFTENLELSGSRGSSCQTSSSFFVLLNRKQLFVIS